MGRTIPPFRPALEMEIATWRDFVRALRPPDRPYFDKVVQYARQHGDAGGMAARPLLTEVIYMCALLEQEKKIATLEEQLASLRLSISNLKD